MVLGTAIGAAIIMAAPFIAWCKRPVTQFRKIVQASFIRHKMVWNEERIRIHSLTATEYGYVMECVLPSGLTVEKFRKYLPALGEDTCSEIRFSHIDGRRCLIQFGRRKLRDVVYYKAAPFRSPYHIPLMTSFGWQYINFDDGASCHLLGGGATRMGKSVFLTMTAAHIFKHTAGQARLLIISPKIRDYWMFEELPNVTLADGDTALLHLIDIEWEMKRRKAILHSKKRVNDAKTLRKRYPNDAFVPVFVIIDEYGAFSDDKKFNRVVTELAERSGYLDIHIIVFAQRPDVQTVLSPRTRANLMARICFSTADENNSNLVIGSPEAAHLGNIPGRAILLDGMSYQVQVPYLTDDELEQMLQIQHIERNLCHADETGQNDSDTSTPLPRDEQGSDRVVRLLRGGTAPCNGEPHTETVSTRSTSDTNTAATGSTVPVHAESSDHSHTVSRNQPLPGSGRSLSELEHSVSALLGAAGIEPPVPSRRRSRHSR